MRLRYFQYISLCIILITALACASAPNKKTAVTKQTNSIGTDTIKIVNEEEEYEIIIIDPGFNTWLVGNAKQRGFYSQKYLEIKNQFLVNQWNLRVNQPNRFNANLYCMRIEYNPLIDYGYEVNYLLYNYFLYFQKKYQQQLI
ncbi:DUF6146 family protein [Ochrovirga pacifica]|uniref:DUF6146 family protein n=1 Tax=Ochrovirga pacifica TaxID=1042376 RepID=UPI0002559DAB|nr:DUF6146 family protein [Ochrovirga pacifica]